jgi:hypothetical protein
MDRCTSGSNRAKTCAKVAAAAKLFISIDFVLVGWDAEEKSQPLVCFRIRSVQDFDSLHSTHRPPCSGTCAAAGSVLR